MVITVAITVAMVDMRFSRSAFESCIVWDSESILETRLSPQDTIIDRSKEVSPKESRREVSGNEETSVNDIADTAREL
jgi:hypothetical protein